MTRKICSTLLVLALFNPLFAESLSLKQALESAKANNATAINAGITLSQQLNQAQVNDSLPSITLKAGASASGSMLGSTWDASFNPTASIAFSLSSADKYSASTSTLAEMSAQNTYTATLNNLESQVTQAYWNVVASNLAIESQQLEVQQKEATYRAVKAQYEGGTANTLSVSQAELSLSDAQLTLQNLEQILMLRKQALQLLVGYEITGNLDPLPEIKGVVSVEKLLAQIENTTTIKALHLKVQDAQLALKAARNTSLSPTISFSASTSLSAAVSTATSSLKDSSSLSVSVSLPLDAYLPNSSSQVHLENLESSIQIAYNNLEAGKQSLMAAVRSSYTSLEMAASTLVKLEKHLQLAEAAYSLTQASYVAGESSYLTLTESDKEVRSAALSILTQKVTYTSSLYDLAYLLQVESSSITTN